MKSKHERALILAVEALALYADPESYFAISFICDRPCGWFADDVSKAGMFTRKIPGKEARKTLLKIKRLLKA